MSETITYKELARRLDSLKLFNKAPELDPQIFEGLENGNLYENDEAEERGLKLNAKTGTYYDESGNEYRDENGEVLTESDGDLVEIYQWYLISPSDADYLKYNTNELIFYSDVLDEYVWGVTHFGTPWEGVTLEFGKETK